MEPSAHQPASVFEDRSSVIIRALFDWVGAHKNALIRGGLVALLLLFLASGFYIVKPGEEAVIQRFGAWTHEQITPGLHYRIPVIERASIRSVEHIQRLEVADNGKGGEVFSLMSGDTNLLETNFIVQFRINKLSGYLFVAENPENIAKKLIRHALITVISDMFVDFLYTSDKGYVQSQIKDRVEEHVAWLGLGITLLSVNLVDISPPPEAIAAFYDINDAISERSQSVTNAFKRKEAMLSRSRADAQHIILMAGAQASARKEQAISEAQQFTAVLSEYHAQPQSVRTSRYWNRISEILARAKLVVLKPGQPADFSVNFLENPSTLPWESRAGEKFSHKLERTETQPVLDRMPGDGQHKPSSEHGHLQKAPPTDNTADTRHDHIAEKPLTPGATEQQK